MKRDNVMLFALLFAALTFLRRRVEWGSGWVWPVPTFKARDNGKLYPAVITDGVGSPRGAGIHHGVDIMYRRASPSDQPEYRAGTTDGTPNFFAPKFTPIVAAKDGRIWSAKKTPRGWAIVIAHGKPFATFYTHLDLMTVAQHEKGKSLVNGQPTLVKAGDVIGLMGHDPLDGQKLRHLHFEVWYEGDARNAVDPGDAMKEWARAPRLFEES